MECLRTERTVLRPWTEADAERLLDIQSRREVVQWLSDDFDNPTLLTSLDEARTHIDTYRERSVPGTPVGFWAIEEVGTGSVAGTVLLVPLKEMDPEVPATGDLEIGWHLHPDAVGRGLATEAARALLARGLAEGTGRVHALLYPDNHPSAKVCQALGMTEQPETVDRWYPGPSRHFLSTR